MTEITERSLEMGLEKWKRHRWAAVSLLAALAVLVGFKLLGVLVYDTNDDALMAGLSYGYYGESSSTSILFWGSCLPGCRAGSRRCPGITWLSWGLWR